MQSIRIAPPAAAMPLTRHYDELLGYFARATGDRDTARDVVQESHARVLALGPQALAGVLDLRALLFRIGRHLVIDDARRRRAEAHALDTLALLCAQDAPSAERTCAARQQLERLSARLAAMPARRRTAFILVRVHGFSHAEAAAHMGVRVAGIEKHIVRATLDLMPARLRPPAAPPAPAPPPAAAP